MAVLLTQKQVERLQRDEKICSSFKNLRKKYPESSTERIICEIAKNYTISNAAIRVICKKSGLC